MDAEALLAVAALLVRWRVAICVAGGLVAAFFVSQLSWTSVPQLLAIVLVSGFAGAAWESRAVAAPGSAQPSRSTRPATLLAAAVVAGAGWGALSASSLSSVVLGAVLVLLALGAWSARRQQAASPSVAVVAACSLLGYVVAVMLVRNAL